MHVQWGGVCSEPELKGRARKQASKHSALRSQVSILVEHCELGMQCLPSALQEVCWEVGELQEPPARGLEQAAWGDTSCRAPPLARDGGYVMAIP